MASKPIAMSTLKQIIRLKEQGKSIKQIVRVCGTSRNTVRKYIALIEQTSFSISELLAMEDQALELTLLPVDSKSRDDRYEVLLARMEYYQQELIRTGVNRWLLWSEYRQSNPNGYSYAQFCYHLSIYTALQNSSLPINHTPGDLLYVDFAGKLLEYVNLSTGEIIKVQVFVATLGFSQYSYVEAVPTQKTIDFISALNRCLQYFKGIPKGIVPDNLKSAVIKTDRYEPELNKLLEDWANHYNTSIIPARSRKPQDKSLAENLVKQTYSRIYAPLRNRVFTSLEDLNDAIRQQLAIHNAQKFKRHDYSRLDLYQSQEKEVLTPLPDQLFHIKKYRSLTLQKNCHIQLTEDKRYYSAPYAYIGQKLEVGYTETMVWIYHKNILIAQHPRGQKQSLYYTIDEHLPSHYNAYLDRSPQYYLDRASKIGSSVRTVIHKLLLTKRHPEQLYRSCEGILSLAKKYNVPDFDKACTMALDLNACTYTFIQNVLKNGTFKLYEQQSLKFNEQRDHENLRRKQYYK
jgi:transposase